MVGTVPQIPRAGTRALLVDLAGVVTGPVAGAGTTSYDVWLATDDPARERTLRRQLAAHGLRVTSRDTTGDHAVAFESEGPSLALRLSLLAGLVAVVLAGATLVVGVATSGASRARDLAGLRLVGVPARTVRTASVREHLVVAVLGVLAGTALGLVAAQAALPDIPLFASRQQGSAARPQPGLDGGRSSPPSAACCCSAPCRSLSAGRWPQPPSRPGCRRADEHGPGHLAAARAGRPLVPAQHGADRSRARHGGQRRGGDRAALLRARPRSRSSGTPCARADAFTLSVQVSVPQGGSQVGLGPALGAAGSRCRWRTVT